MSMEGLYVTLGYFTLASVVIAIAYLREDR